MSNSNFNEIDRLFERLNNLNIGNAQEALGRLREILRQQDQTIRNLNDELAQNRQTIREHENTIRTLTARNNDLANQINGVLADHSNHFTRINNNLDQLIRTPNPDLVNRLNRISQSVDGLQTQFQPLRNDLNEMKSLIKDHFHLNETNLIEKINAINDKIDHFITDSLNDLTNLNRSNEYKLNEMNRTLNQLKSDGKQHCEKVFTLRYSGEHFIEQCHEYFTNKTMVFFSFIIFLIGIFYCICGRGNYIQPMTGNGCLKSC